MEFYQDVWTYWRRWLVKHLTGQQLTFDMITVTTSSQEDVGFWNLFEQQRTDSSVKNFTSVVEAVTKLESAFERRYCHYLAGIFETTLWKEYSSLLYFRTLQVWKKGQMQMNQGKLSHGIISWGKINELLFRGINKWSIKLINYIPLQLYFSTFWKRVHSKYAVFIVLLPVFNVSLLSFNFWIM